MDDNVKLREGFTGQRSIVMPKMILDLMETDEVTRCLQITDIGYYPHAAYHYRRRSEPIDQNVFIYCIAGHGWVECGGRRHEIGSDTFFVIPANEPHRYGADDADPWTIYWIHFRGTLADHIARGLSTPRTVTAAADSRISNRNEMFEEIYQTLENSLSLDNLRYAVALLHHYLGSLRFVSQYRGSATSEVETDVVGSIIHFMTENIEKQLTLDDLAAYSGYSRSHLSSVFRRVTGQSPVNYLNLTRIRTACLLLDSTSMRVNQICHKVGISDQYYFSRLFAKIMGMSPRAYKNRQKA